MRVADPNDQKFITLMRQSYTLPFAPLPCTAQKSADDLDHPGEVLAVFQPIDKIGTRVLNDLEQSHRDRYAWQQAQRGVFRAAATQGVLPLHYYT